MATDAELEKLQRQDHDALIRVETKIDSFISAQADHEARIRIVESNNDKLQGTIRGLRWALGIGLSLAGLVEPMVFFYLGTHK